MNPIGIMQGRLSPPVGGRIQAFPVDTWREEFGRAKEAGLAGIEWVYEAESEAANPLRGDDGVDAVRRLVEESGVAVWSVCADYYMSERLVSPDGQAVPAAVEHLRLLLGRVGRLGVRYVVLPFVDASALCSPAEQRALRAVLGAVLPAAEEVGVELHLETDLAPRVVAALLEEIRHPLLRANYDTGNSAALGRDPREELGLLGPWLGSVHIKDRLRGGGTVPLGTGAVDFSMCLGLLARVGYRRPLILQPARGPSGDEVAWAVRNRLFVEQHLAAIPAQR